MDVGGNACVRFECALTDIHCCRPTSVFRSQLGGRRISGKIPHTSSRCIATALLRHLHTH